MPKMIEIKVRIDQAEKNRLEAYLNHPSFDELLDLALKQYLMYREYH